MDLGTIAAGKALAAVPSVHMPPHMTMVLGLAGAGLVVAYLISLWLHPNCMCRRCGGRGKVSGAFFTWGQRGCPRCHTTGMVPRLGTVLLGIGGRASVARSQAR